MNPNHIFKTCLNRSSTETTPEVEVFCLRISHGHSRQSEFHALTEEFFAKFWSEFQVRRLYLFFKKIKIKNKKALRTE